MKDTTENLTLYLKQAATLLFKEKILSALADYQNIIRQSKKPLHHARLDDIIEITALVEGTYPMFKTLWHTIKARVDQMTIPWGWVYESRLKIRLQSILSQYEHPLAVAQIIENAKLRRILDETRAKVDELEKLNQTLENKLKPISVSKSTLFNRTTSSPNFLKSPAVKTDIELNDFKTQDRSCPHGMFSRPK